MTDQTAADSAVEQLRALRAAQIELLWPAAEAAARTSDHAQLVELIKIYTAVQAIDFALANRPDPNAATRTRVGFQIADAGPAGPGPSTSSSAPGPLRL